MEEEREVSYWEVIFKANSFTDLLDRLNMVAEIAQADRRHLKELSDAADAVVLAQDALEEEKSGLEAVKKEQLEAEKELNAKREEADELIRHSDHLHFGISYNGSYVNPCLYVNLS